MSAQLCVLCGQCGVLVEYRMKERTSWGLLFGEETFSIDGGFC